MKAITSVPSNRARKLLGDIIENIDRITNYTTGMAFDDWVGNQMVVDAVERCLQRITEASINLAKIDENLLPDQDWKRMRGFGNRLRHGYNDLDPTIVWNTVTDYLPPLRDACDQARGV